jgi:hypothetical protein
MIYTPAVRREGGVSPRCQEGGIGSPLGFQEKRSLPKLPRRRKRVYTSDVMIKGGSKERD